MNRKSLILCCSVLALMLTGIGVAVAFLYSGQDKTGVEAADVSQQNRYMLLSAVPSDAVAVVCMSEAEEMEGELFSEGLMKAAGSSRAAVSLHHSGSLIPLYVFDGGRVADSLSKTASAILAQARSEGMFAETVNCDELAECSRNLSGRNIVIASRQENLVKSSVRHLMENTSVAAVSGFAEAAASVSSDDVLFLANDHVKRILSSVLSSRYSSYASFLMRFADWTVFALDDKHLSGTAVHDRSASDYMSVFEALQPGVSQISSVLPSYTLSAVTFPARNPDEYIPAYERYMDSRQALADYRNRQKSVAVSGRPSPEQFMKTAHISEFGKASFKVDGKMVEVNLMRLSDGASAGLFPEDIFKKSYVPAVHEYVYPGYLASLFGNIFKLKSETHFTYIDGWIISGSKVAIDDYVDNKATEYSLKDKMKDAGQTDLFAEVPLCFAAYLSFTEDKDELSEMFSRSFLKDVDHVVDGHDFCPMLFTVRKEKKNTVLDVGFYPSDMARTKAPAVERDTTVVIPQGPFMVKNSGTGKMNKFYQNSHLSLCLSEDGKDLWGVPFKEKLCGYARTIDYFANGKLQILFGAGQKMYLMDRLGRMVNGFPVDLGKDILLGPQPYDFNGNRRYNVMVLHKDKTVEMYNMKGQKPDSWKGIRTEETIKALPERIVVGGKTFWVLRTSIQTLIFPFSGGEPLTAFEGDDKIRPDSEVRILDESSVEVESYNGKRRTVMLK